SPSVTSMVSANGVVLTVEDRATTEDINAPVEYVLVARDAFNGIELWKRTLEKWGSWQTNSIKSIPTQQQRNLAVIGDSVYCCAEFGGSLTVYETRTGVLVRVFGNTEETTEFAIDGNVLYAIKGTPYRLKKRDTTPHDVELYALDLRQGTMIWRLPIASDYTGGTLAAKGTRLVYHSKNGLTCLDSASGKPLWTEAIEAKSATAADDTTLSAKEMRRRARRKGKKAKSAGPVGYSHNSHPTIVIADEMVFSAIAASINAKRLGDGKTLWTATGQTNYMKSPDLFVANGVVWGRDLQGRDAKTGKIIRALKQEVTGPMSHDRCYRNRITHRYYLNSASGGTDFLKLDGKAESPNPWVRSTCGLAVMPANGMIYSGPYVCQCAIGAMITGMNGLYNGTGNSDTRFTTRIEPRLIKGPAYGQVISDQVPSTGESDWPTYRYSSARSAVSGIAVPTKISRKWKVTIGSHPTAPVVAGQHVYVADRDGYALYALDRSNGKTRWTFTAGGRIDSPPTYHRGVVLFGSRGGWVYCLRASDGQMVWTFNGMPERRLICDGGRLESAWPVNGSVTIEHDTAYFAAGRSTFLDGGIGVFGLDPFSGKMKYGKIMQGPYQDDGRSFPIPASGTFQLEGFRSGIFSSADNTLFIRHQAFTLDLTPVKLAAVKTLHLMASPGFLNDSPQHRTYWTVDRDLRYGGPTAKFGNGPAGDAIAFDGKRFCEIRGYAPGRNLPGRGKTLKPTSVYSIFSGDLVSRDHTGRKDDIASVGKWEKKWDTPTPFAGHAIAAARNTVLAAGVPMLKGFSTEDTNASYAGERGGIVWLLNRSNGEKLQEIRLDAAPTWDGIAIAHGNYFICLKDGSVVCYSEEH
ncbi:MAG: PQQ-binding-like beta-propeller repeat protein, partial [Lentisphaerae bacterium]|nr:PQQ-binding-like beta-propeller repeat protein [Lentisphaerota bacterium]